MIEDKSFNAFLKAKLEEDVVVPEVSCKPTVRWWRSALIAAELAIVCGIFAWQVMYRRDAARERHTVQAIELLDDGEGVYVSDVFAERLLAWQDAPFAEVSRARALDMAAAADGSIVQ